VIDEITHFWLKSPLCGERDVFSVAKGYERNSEQALQDNSGNTLGIEVSAIKNVWTAG
jgi:hypothetical protein